MSGNTNLGNNRLDGFSHGGNYGVSQQATSGMDVFTVDRVGRNPSPQPLPPRALANGSQPPPYSSVPPPPPWSIVQNPNATQPPSTNGIAVNGKAIIYDPNADADSLSDQE